MLLLTAVVDYAGSGISLWLALYLLGRGFSSRITLRAVVVLLASSLYFLSAYVDLYLPLHGIASLHALLITIGLAVWCDLSAKLFLPDARGKVRRLVGAAYAFGLLNGALLIAASGSAAEQAGSELWIQRPDLSPASILYGAFILSAGLVTLYHVLAGVRIRSSAQKRYFLITTILIFNLVGYGTLNLIFAPPMPRWVQDVLVFVSVLLLGIAVAQQQVLVERRVARRDFIVSALAVFIPAALYALIAWQWSHAPGLLILASLLAIVTHGGYDLVREFLERMRQESENRFRRHMRRLENHWETGTPLQNRLQQGLKLLCQILEAEEGLVAVREQGVFVVAASYHSVSIGSGLSPGVPERDDIYRPAGALASRIEWVAPAFAAGEQLGVIGLGPSKTRLRYSEDDLDLLAEAADRVGMIVHLDRLQASRSSGALQATAGTQSAPADELINTLVTNPDPEFVGMVEEGLRNLSDIIWLGQYPLSQSLDVPGETHIERGKAVRERLIRAIEMLRPDKLRPQDTLPREWYGYVVLHDAYIEGAPNRDIMARLYISEGTFNRTRRKALRGVARLLMETRDGAVL